MPTRIIYILCTVQFINILDFMMVMPLGPDFSQALGIPTSALGFIGGSYTMAASVMGILSATFLDRFGRRSALSVCFLGLSIATILGGLSWDYPSLLFSRCLAGLFGGPTSALSLAVIADTVEEKYRGRAMGVLMGSFSLASVLGVPIGLELAHRGSWHTPFFAVGGTGLVICFLIYRNLPPLTAHIDLRGGKHPTILTSLAGLIPLLGKRIYLLGLANSAAVMFAAFLLIPNIASYLQFDLGYPRDGLGLLYMIGGLLSFGGMRVAGYFVDKVGGFRTSVAATVAFILLIFLFFASDPVRIPIPVGFTLFMLCMSLRNIPMQAVASRIPLAKERASYLSLQSAVQHAACSLGAFTASVVLVSEESGKLDNMPLVATLSMCFAAIMPFLIKRIESELRARTVSAQVAA